MGQSQTRGKEQGEGKDPEEIDNVGRKEDEQLNSSKVQLHNIKGADTPPTPTQNGILVAMPMVYLLLLVVEIFRYAGEQSTL